MKRARGEFQCRVCREKLSMDPEDDETFLSKTEHGKFLGMNLATYHVAHTMGKELHINSIIVDNEGYFHGHRDFYSERIRHKGQPRINHFWIMSKEVPSLSENRLVKLAFMTDRRERWVIELVTPRSVNTREMALMAADCIEEAERVYKPIPNHVNMRIADHELEVWVVDSRLLCLEAWSSRTVPLMEKLGMALLSSQHNRPVPSKQLMIFALSVIEEHPEFLNHPDLISHF